MVEVFDNLYVGSDEDYFCLDIKNQLDGWACVHAAKEPFHRIFCRYTGRSAPKGPEYLYAVRDNRLALNMVDAQDPVFFSTELFDRALAFIGTKLKAGLNVLVHCNRGGSRGPSVALLYMAARAGTLPAVSYETAAEAFYKIYPLYNPGHGITGHLKQYWGYYVKGLTLDGP